MISIHAYRDKQSGAWVRAKSEDAARIEEGISPPETTEFTEKADTEEKVHEQVEEEVKFP